MLGLSLPQGDILYASQIITKIMQHLQAAPSFAFYLFNKFAAPSAGKEFFSFISVYFHTNQFLLL